MQARKFLATTEKRIFSTRALINVKDEEGAIRYHLDGRFVVMPWRSEISIMEGDQLQAAMTRSRTSWFRPHFDIESPLGPIRIQRNLSLRYTSLQVTFGEDEFMVRGNLFDTCCRVTRGTKLVGKIERKRGVSLYTRYIVIDDSEEPEIDLVFACILAAAVVGDVEYWGAL